MNAFRLILLSVALFGLFVPAGAFGFDQSHKSWTDLLQKHVAWNQAGTASAVDYSGFQRDQKLLDGYLSSLSSVTTEEFNRWSKNRRLAFLLNAYNAYTVKLILTRYPELKSIKDLGGFFTSPWKLKFYELLGEKQSLDGIEHDLIRGSGLYHEPLIHFALNCASIGCPALRDEAYVADRLDKQLLDQIRRFLADNSRNRFDAEQNILYVSSIFDWYADDFEQGWRGYDSVKDFFATHAGWISSTPEQQRLVQAKKFKLEFLAYDWNLNRQ